MEYLFKFGVTFLGITNNTRFDFYNSEPFIYEGSNTFDQIAKCALPPKIQHVAKKSDRD